LPRRQSFVVEPKQKGVTPYRLLCRALGVPSGFVKRLVVEGHVTVDGSSDALNLPLKSGAVLEVVWPEELHRQATTKTPRQAVKILYEDAHRLVVDKPAGVPVVPERRRWKKTVLDLLEATAGDYSHLKVVHRLDKHTSGALLLARDRGTKRELCQAFLERRIGKEYLALVRGRFPEDEGEIDAPISKDRRHALRMVIEEGRGKPSVTQFRVEERLDGYTWLRLFPLTGRTHQIRVHLAHRGFPILGDSLYGARAQLLLSDLKRGYRPKRGQEERPILDRVALHSCALEFDAVEGGEERLRVESPLARDLDVVRRQLARWRAPRT